MAQWTQDREDLSVNFQDLSAGGRESAAFFSSFSRAAQSLVRTVGRRWGTGEAGGGAPGTLSGQPGSRWQPRAALARCGRAGARRGGCSCSGSPTAGAAEPSARAARLSGQLLGDRPRRVAKSSARGRPGVPVAARAEGGGGRIRPGPARGEGNTPESPPRALAPCDPPRLLPGPGLHSLLAEPPAVAAAESGTEEEEKEEEATPGKAAPGRIRLPPPNPPNPELAAPGFPSLIMRRAPAGL
nr:serine/arginine repetitive matrix protein 3-like [Meriones unguiculatus]